MTAARDEIADLEAQAELAKTEATRAELAALRKQVEPSLGEDGPRIRDLAQAVLEAQVALRAACAERNDRIGEIGAQLVRHQVPEHNTGAPEPSPLYAGIARTPDGGVAVGRARMRPVDADVLLERAATSAARVLSHGATPDRFDDVAELDREAPPLDTSGRTRYFRHATDAQTVLTFDRDHLTPELARGLGPELSAAEAERTWHGLGEYEARVLMVDRRT
jgi:hypothetical protein